MNPRHRAVLVDLSHELLDAALTTRIHLSLGQSYDARGELYRALDVMADLDARLPTEPPPAPAGDGPLYVQETPYP